MEDEEEEEEEEGQEEKEKDVINESVQQIAFADRIILNKDHYSSCHFAKEINKKLLYERFNKS